MAYSSAHFRKVLDLGGKIGGGLWALDTIDAITDVDTAGYISDAKIKGVRKGDIVIVRVWPTALPTADSQLLSADGSDIDLTSVGLHWVIGMSAAGAADLANTLAITATNTD